MPGRNIHPTSLIDNATAPVAAAHDLGAVHVVGGQVGQRPAPLVFVFHPHQPSPRRQARVAAAPGLDAGLLVGADHELLGAQRLAVEGPGVEIQRHGCLGREIRVTREDPHTVEPRPDGIGMKHPPDCGRRDGSYHRPADHFPGQLSATPPRRRNPSGGWQLTGQLFDLRDRQRGKNSGVDPIVSAPPGPPALPRRSAYAI